MPAQLRVAHTWANLTQSLFYNKVWVISWYLLIIVSNMTNCMAKQILFHTSVELKTHTRDHLSLKLSHGKVNKLPQHTHSHGRKAENHLATFSSASLLPLTLNWAISKHQALVNTAPSLRLIYFIPFYIIYLPFKTQALPPIWNTHRIITALAKLVIHMK